MPAPFFSANFAEFLTSNSWALSYGPSTCNVAFRYSVLPLVSRLHEQRNLRDTTQRSNVGHAQGDKFWPAEANLPRKVQRRRKKNPCHAKYVKQKNK